MNIPYRTQRRLRSIGTFVLVVAVIAAVCWLCWLLWLGRFVVYTREGVILDFDKSNQQMSGQLAKPPEYRPSVDIFYNEGDNAVNTGRELLQLQGYYASAQDLRKNLSAVREQIGKLSDGAAVMIDVKSIVGSFFYSSEVGSMRDSKINPQAMDELIAEINSRGLYTIAMLPAFQDNEYGRSHYSDGLAASGGYLWMDADGSRCYWLNPTTQGTVSWLTRIVSELRSLGFDEVCFYDFKFPDTNEIVFKGDKKQAIAKAAEMLVTTCATQSFAVSFVGDSSFALPEGRSRLYMENVSAAQCAEQAAKTGLLNPDIRVVFLTDTHDTRFNDYGVLRPISTVE